MTIRVRYFASLRERFGCSEAAAEWRAGMTAADVWAEATQGAALPPQVMIAINLDYAAADSVVKDRDEVAFLPPITGG